MTWPDATVYGDNGSYRRGLPQPVDRPSACGLKVWWVVARTHLISLQIVNSPYRCPTRWWRTACMVGHYLRVTPGFFCCQRVYSMVGKEISRNAVVQLPGLHTGSFCLKTGTRRALEVDAKTNGSSPSLPCGESTQSCGWKPARLPTTSMAGTDPLMFNDHTMPPECLLKIDT